MNTRVPSGVSSTGLLHLLHADWQLLGVDAGAFSDPQSLNFSSSNSDAQLWSPAIVPGTVAQSLGLGLDAVGNLDAKDWWYRCRFARPNASAHAVHSLRFDGLATLADVWLNGKKILTSNNMFVAHECKVEQLLDDDNELLICFRSIDSELSARKPRPRWKTALVAQQNLRWLRTTLLGRIAAWTPALAPVGPWRDITLITNDIAELAGLQVRADVVDDIKQIKIVAALQVTSTHTTVQSAKLTVGPETFDLPLADRDGLKTIDTCVTVNEAPLWWPHTHGSPALVDCRIDVQTSAGTVVINAGRIGFKSVVVNRHNDDVQFIVNGAPVFCRGACWTVNEIISLVGNTASLRTSLQLAQRAGMNMLRIGGTMLYESDAFYEACDELGIMVWQDFMFANMDYPVGDAEFRTNIEREVSYQLNRLQKHPCIAVYCGGSEVQQQAAMLGLPSGEWSNEFFDHSLPALCEQWHPFIPYFPSTPCEGALPFHLNKGLGHYYGVGAFKRPVNDVKIAHVKFSPECLGFSNVPEDATAELLGNGSTPPPHDPRWKARVPRDPSAGWDFEDIRDHYIRELFNVDPVALRSVDSHRYYEISRVVTGELMKTVFAHWRKPDSHCGGGLIWFYKDIWPGAGWGVIDSLNRPKAVFHYLRRAFASQAILISDEGFNGLDFHVLNETDTTRDVIVGFEAFQHGRISIARAEVSAQLGTRSSQRFNSDAMLGYFSDLAYAFRFGPPKHDVVRAYLKCAITGELISDDFYFPSGLALLTQDGEKLSATASFQPDGRVLVTIKSACFLQSVHFECKDYIASDNYFHLAPGQEKHLYFSRNENEYINSEGREWPHKSATTSSFKTELMALNLSESLTVRAQGAQSN